MYLFLNKKVKQDNVLHYPKIGELILILNATKFHTWEPRKGEALLESVSFQSVLGTHYKKHTTSAQGQQVLKFLPEQKELAYWPFRVPNVFCYFFFSLRH